MSNETIMLDLTNDLVARVKASSGYVGMEIFSPAVEQIGGGWIPAMYIKVNGIEDARKIVIALQRTIKSAEMYEEEMDAEAKRIGCPI